MRKLVYHFAFIAAAISISSCASHKKDQSYAGRVWHNTTSHYNGYYYASLKMKESEDAVIASRKEDYDKLLPIYLVGNPGENMSGSDMDSIIRRLTIVVKLHPKSKWADDCYYNIGKAYFYKEDYESAGATFQFVSSEFKDENTSSGSHSSSHKKKKGKSSSKDKNTNKYTGTVKEQSQSSGFKMLKHKSIHYTDVLWLVRSQAMAKNFGGANAILNYLDQDTKFPLELKPQLQLMHAFVFIEQKQYRNAIEPMQEAIKFTKSKKEITRYTYILAQLYELSGDYGTAGKTFATIPAMHPGYEMDFNSRIRVVRDYVASGSGSPTQIITDLQEMAKNKNFEEFYDQIYYYIGLVQLKQGKDEQALKSFETSIDQSVSNQNQKGLSFLKIGEMSMAEQDYVTAAEPYDSAATFLSDKFDTLDRVKELRDILKNVAAQIAIIITEDSLQQLGAMDPKARNKIIDQMVLKDQREKQDAMESNNMTNVFSNQTSNNQNNGSGGGSWYFDNATLRASGYNEFVKRWGNRDNADNWRRANKKSGGNDEQASNDNNDGEASDSSGNGKDASASKEGGLFKQLLDNVPTTPEKLKASNKKIFNAWYTLGTIYSSELNNLPKAIDAFEKIVARFSDDTAIVKVYYNLYLLYEKTGNNTKAEAYRQKILGEYPASVFAIVLNNPNYFKEQEEKKNAVNTFYASTYDFYQAELFSDVFARVKRADSLFHPNPLEAKFDMLEALSIGRTQDRNAYIAALDTIIKKFPAGEEHDMALEILTALGAAPKVAKDEKDLAKKDDKPKGPSPYKFSPNNPHYFIVYFTTTSPKIKAISDSLANFDTKNHSLENLKVQSQMIDKNSQMIVVKQFKNKDDALSYYDEITDSETLFEQVEAIGYRVFVIDDKNFIQFYQHKDLNQYLDFYEKNYENSDDDDDGGD